MKLREVEVGKTVTGPLGRRIRRIAGRHGDARRSHLVPVAVVERGELEPPWTGIEPMAAYWCAPDLEVEP